MCAISTRVRGIQTMAWLVFIRRSRVDSPLIHTKCGDTSGGCWSVCVCVCGGGGGGGCIKPTHIHELITLVTLIPEYCMILSSYMMSYILLFFYLQVC